jgi:FtsZ-binding cell division protein ZapB
MERELKTRNDDFIKVETDNYLRIGQLEKENEQIRQQFAYYQNAFLSLLHERKNEFYEEMPIDLTFKSAGETSS